MGKQIDFLFKNFAAQVEKDGACPEILKGTKAERVIQEIILERRAKEVKVG